MDEQREYIMQRLSKEHFEALMEFYRGYFPDDASCIQFIFDAIKNEPPNDSTIYREQIDSHGNYANENGVAVESLQSLGNPLCTSMSKVQVLLDFFETYTSDSDKQYIRTHFWHDDDDLFDPKEDSFRQFIGVLNEYRNCAVHEGDYWDYCFNNNCDGFSALLVLCIDPYSFRRPKLYMISMEMLAEK